MPFLKKILDENNTLCDQLESLSNKKSKSLAKYKKKTKSNSRQFQIQNKPEKLRPIEKKLKI